MKEKQAKRNRKNKSCNRQAVEKPVRQVAAILKKFLFFFNGGNANLFSLEQFTTLNKVSLNFLKYTLWY